jgi:hypothetical protein
MHIFTERTLDGLGDFTPMSETAAKELLAGPLEAARENLHGELTCARHALQRAAESGADAASAISAVEGMRHSLEMLGARAFFAHEFLHGTDEHPDAVTAGNVCALAQEFPCDETSANEYLGYVDELIASLKAMKAAA